MMRTLHRVRPLRERFLAAERKRRGIRQHPLHVGVHHTKGRTSPPALHHQSASKPRAFLPPGGHQPFCLLFHSLWLLQPCLPTEHMWLLMFRGLLSAHHRSQILIICISCIFQMPWENRNVEGTPEPQLSLSHVWLTIRRLTHLTEVDKSWWLKTFASELSNEHH